MADKLLPLSKAPIFIKKPESQTVYEGSKFEFICQIHQQPNVQVSWMKDGKAIVPDEYNVTSDGEIHKLGSDCASCSDAGRFVCVAKNEFSERRALAGLVVLKNAQQGNQKSVLGTRKEEWKAFSKLDSNEDPKIDSNATICFDKITPNSLIPSSSSSLMAPNKSPSDFKNTSYNCIKFSSCLPNVRNKSIIKKLNDRPMSDKTCQEKVIASHLEASNHESKNCVGNETPEDVKSLLIGSDNNIVLLSTVDTKSCLKDLKVPEVFHLQPDNLHVVRGSDILLTAAYACSSLDDLQIKWFRGTNEILPDDRTLIEIFESLSTLRINNSQPHDSECYTISIKNKCGSDQLSSSVTVEDKPEPPFKPPTVSNITQNSVVLSWYGPVFDGASPLLGYKIEQLQLADGDDEDNFDWKVISDDCQHTTYLVADLKPYTNYKFRISCRNKHGFSKPGAHSQTITTLRTIYSENNASSIESLENIVHIVPTRKFQDYYSIGSIIGRGKFGVVKECFNKVTNKKYAVKVMKTKLDQVTNFRQEVNIMNQLHHSKLLRIQDAFEEAKEAFLVMEFIGGRELLERITTEDYTLTEGDCVCYVRQICQGVHYMHGKNILHLDLKLENILCLTNGGKAIKIIDFGLSRVYDPKDNMKIMFGTPEFVAPEVINFDPVAPPTDMWSLGVIAYILLSGFSPFSGENDSETLCNITRAHYDFEDGFEGVSQNAKNFIESLLRKDPKMRMTSQECLRHDWMDRNEADKVSTKLSTLQHKKFLNRRRWQKSGNAIRALSRLTGESKFVQRPRGMSVDRKTFLTKLLHRKDSIPSDGVLDFPFSENKQRSELMAGILERQRSRSFDDLFCKNKKVAEHMVVCKVRSCMAPSR